MGTAGHVAVNVDKDRDRVLLPVTVNVDKDRDRVLLPVTVNVDKDRDRVLLPVTVNGKDTALISPQTLTVTFMKNPDSG